MKRQTWSDRQAGGHTARYTDKEWESDKRCVSASLSTLMFTLQTSTHDSRWQLIPIVQIVGAKLSTGQDFGGQRCLTIVRTMNLLALIHTVNDPCCIETLLVTTWLVLTCHHNNTSINNTVSTLHLFFFAASHWSWLRFIRPSLLLYDWPWSALTTVPVRTVHP